MTSSTATATSYGMASTVRDSLRTKPRTAHASASARSARIRVCCVRSSTGSPSGRRDQALKKRLDVVLVERGLAESRAPARALGMAGQGPGYDQPGQQVDEQAELTVAHGPAYVSRGGDKLAHGLDALGIDPRGLDA